MFFLLILFFTYIYFHIKLYYKILAHNCAYLENILHQKSHSWQGIFQHEKGRGSRGIRNLGPAWSMQHVSEQPGLYSKTLPQKTIEQKMLA